MDGIDLDARGLRCPMPTLKARKRLEALPAGAVLRVLADDPMAAIDLPHFCAEGGHELVETAPAADGARLYVIRKGA